ncbi:hypothetical protein EJV47_07205 [Hymenobacter gummosus]|uniref:Apea-like HEPN domain-containing protein n=1 Tax=Hymenobacter gummosus TaxID=1776032 RepID=A0A3S0JBY6_9BACT|nr:hypothetical protein [Hymenobacter gummosus]RTQ51580.1 hypothetical protein EJV47_07205 [Hymenobacter gummosus]
MDNFNPNAWISKRYGVHNFDQLTKGSNSMYFVWVYAMFEREVISKGQGDNMINRILSALTQVHQEYINIDEHILFFRGRYFDKQNKPTKYLKSLRFPKSHFAQLKRALLEEETSKESKIQVLILITYSFRCNLFHGGKDPLLWHGFDDVFSVLIELLTQVIDHQKNNTYNAIQ